jgi:25S rRNA (adenine2142-N1)-methyltransferase
LDFHTLHDIMVTVGFRQIKERWRSGGKMVYWLYEKAEPLDVVPDRCKKKQVLKSGNRNNFCVLL